MDAEKKPKPQSNTLLRSQREIRNFTLQDVADKLYEMCVKEGRESGISADTVGRWERGISQPEAHCRAKLSELFGKSTTELGLKQEHLVESSQTPTPPSGSPQSSLFGEERYNGANLERGAPLAVQEVPVVLIPTHHATDLLRNTSDATSEQKLGALLALEANELAMFFDEGWSVEELLVILRVVLSGAQVMSKITRRAFGRKLFRFGVAAAVSGIPIPSGRHVSAEDLATLHTTLGESIAAGWKLFHTAGNPQVLAVGQAQLVLVQEASAYLYPTIRPIFYSSAYNLIGAAYHFQGRYNDAYKAHEQAYIAALEAMDVLNMAQSRAWQANGLREQQRYSEALQTIEAALRLVSQQRDTASIRLQAHLFASNAEMAAFLGNDTLMHRYLDASQTFLAQLPYEYNDEFDHASWHQYKGTCALILNQNDTATEELQVAIESLPPQSMVRHIITLTPLAIAYARERNRERCLETIKRATTVVKTINSASLNKQFVDYLQREILVPFADDQDIQALASETQQRLMLGATNVIPS
jgi:tetratricopeptide (TPR) repeat protein